MKRAAPMQRKTPLARTGFKRPEPSAAFKTTFHTKTLMRKAALKTRRKRVTVAEGAKYLAACRDEPCYLNVLCPWTDWADPTVVDCHSNQSKHGKAGARKADHEFTVPGCARCHDWYDNSGAPYELKCAKFDNALERWAPRRARKMGLTMQEAA
ncbi:hypothetical protein J2794_003578 [Paraburkholderia terricola]|uniref:hypothetical protein n=1 Tax=Paraburkholderia terricola TaxID=169427 RepID=UPI0028663858|nr:hypothetical protein [Paraburkholderia terricola]MDR6447462.1 hypothetical protein [Paraburkholderia terricola]